MKAEKFKKLKDEVVEFVVEYVGVDNLHYTPNDVFYKAFSNVKKKHIKRVLEEVR